MFALTNGLRDARALCPAQLGAEVKQGEKGFLCVHLLKQCKFVCVLSLYLCLYSVFFCASVYGHFSMFYRCWCPHCVDVSVHSHWHPEPDSSSGVCPSVKPGEVPVCDSCGCQGTLPSLPSRLLLLLLPPRPPPHSCLLSCVHWPLAHSLEHVLFISHS